MSKEKKHKKGLTAFGIIVLVLVLILAIIIGGTYWYINSKLSKIQKVDIDEKDLNVSAQAEEQLADYRNIAIFGIDSREDTYDKGNRSDCIIIASINNKTKDVKLVSVYRDTYVQIEGHGLDKITHAYSYGEAPLAIKTLNINLDTVEDKTLKIKKENMKKNLISNTISLNDLIKQDEEIKETSKVIDTINDESYSLNDYKKIVEMLKEIKNNSNKNNISIDDAVTMSLINNYSIDDCVKFKEILESNLN